MAKKGNPKKLVKFSPPKLIKLDLSYGPLPDNHPYTRMDFDPFDFPWPLKDKSVEEAFSAYLLHRVPAQSRGQWMDELYRVLVDEGKAIVITPYWTSFRSVQDYCVEWPPVVEQSYLYFNKGFRDANKIDYPIKADFDFQYGYTLDADTQSRTDEERAFRVKFYNNSVLDLQVTLTKRKAGA